MKRLLILPIIISVVFYFGTAEGNLVSAPAVTEPATMLLLGSGLLGLAALARRKFRK